MVRDKATKYESSVRRKLKIAGTLFFLLIVLLPGVYAKNSFAEVTATVRIGKHADRTRIVLETTEGYVQKASVTLSGSNGIKVDFRSPIVFKIPQKGALKPGSSYEIAKGIQIAAYENSCMISVADLDDINVSKLSSPSRLVIDIFVGQPAPSSPPPSPAPSQPTAEESKGNHPQQSALPPIETADIKIDSFVIDAGHGGSDTGVRCGKIAEKDIALSIAKDLASALGKKGKKVFLTRKGDQDVSLKERIRSANRKSPEMFISIHMSCRSEFTLYVTQKKGAKTAEGIVKNVSGAERKDVAGMVARVLESSIKGEFKTNIAHEKLPARVLACINAPALLIELPSPEKFHYEGKDRERLINALLRAVASASPVQA